MPTQSDDMRVLARRVIFGDRVYGLSLVSVCGREVTVEPFSHETAATTYHSGTVRILLRSRDDEGGCDMPVVLFE